MFCRLSHVLGCSCRESRPVEGLIKSLSCWGIPSAALDYFRAGVAIPSALVKLAVEVDIREEVMPHHLEAVVAANLLEEYGEERSATAPQDRKGYRLPDLVATWLTQRRQQEGGKRPFWEAQAKPTQQGRLLAAFLTTFGKESTKVPQKATDFLKKQGVLGSDDCTCDPSLSEDWVRAAELASRIGHGLGEVTVLALVLGCCGATKGVLGNPEEALQSLDRADGQGADDASTFRARAATKASLRGLWRTWTGRMPWSPTMLPLSLTMGQPR
jgi:hypothetical protein